MEKKLAEVYYHMGLKEIKNRNISKAVPLLQKVVGLDSGHINGWNVLGLCFYQLGAFGQAKESWMQSIEKEKEDNKAEEYLEYLESKGFREIVSVYNRVMNMIGQGQYRRSIKLLKQQEIKDSHIAVFSNLRGLCYNGIKGDQKALEAWGETLTIDKENPQALRYIRKTVEDKQPKGFLGRIKIPMRNRS